MIKISVSKFDERFLYLFEDSLSDEIDHSDLPLEGALINSQILDFNALSERELSAINVLELRAVLATSLPKIVQFDKKRLKLWAKDALKFFQANRDHNDFIELFSNSLNYEIIIRETIVFDRSTRALQLSLEDLTGINLDGKISPIYTLDFLDVVAELSPRAIKLALRSLAYELLESPNTLAKNLSEYETRLDRVKRAPSFKSIKGTIPFSVTNDRLEIKRFVAGTKTSVYKPQLDRAIERIQNKNILERIHNRDPEISELFAEYKEKFSQHEGQIINLWYIGNEIELRVKLAHSGQNEDVLDGSTLAFISAFLTAHNIYLQSFPEVDQLSEDVSRAAELYRNLDEGGKNAPWSVLKKLADDAEIFVPDTAKIMQTASDASTKPDVNKSKGLVAICLSLLRGSLREMASLILDSCMRLILDDSEAAFSEIIKNSILQSSLQTKIVKFFIGNYDAVSQLAVHLPSYFSWIANFLFLLS